MKLLVIVLALTLLLAACAGPAPASVDEHSLPATLPAELAAGPTSPPPAKPTAEPSPTAAQVAEACSQAPLETGMLVAVWLPEKRLNRLQPVDAESGQPLCGYEPLLAGPVVYHTRSQDGARSQNGARLALIDRKESDKESRVRIVDLRTWQVSEFTVPIAGFVTRTAFSPDGSRLAVSYSTEMNRGPNMLYTDELAVLDLEKGMVLSQASLDIAVRLMAFTGDGEALALFGAPDGSPPEGIEKPPARALLLDVAGLSPAWSQPLPEVQAGVLSYEMGEDQMPLFQYAEPGLAFDAASQTLYIVHSGEDRLTTVDFAGRRVASQEIRPQLSWLERLLYATSGVAHAKGSNGTTKQATLSPDGGRLYVTGWMDTTFKNGSGEWQFEQEPLGVQVIDPASGTEIKRLDIDATSLILSKDGRFLFLQNWMGDLPWTEAISTESWNSVRSLTVSSLVQAQRLGGDTVLLSQRYSQGVVRIAVLDPERFEEVASWELLLGEMQEDPVW